MVTTLVTGATGRLGTALTAQLTAAGHDVQAASRSPPDAARGAVEWVQLDLTAAIRAEAVLDGVEVVVHAATAPQGDSVAVDVKGTKRLLAAAADAGVERFVYPSIVGVDAIPYDYYERKRAAERAVADSVVPSTVVRATQFHGFVADLLDLVAKLPVWPLPTTVPVQPVAVSEVAAAIVKHATPDAAGPSGPIGGPTVHTVGELARAYRRARGLRRPIVRVPYPGSTWRALRAGHATAPDHAVGTIEWEEWLADRFASDGADGGGDATENPSL